MYRIRKLVREIHRRTVWQVLGAYLVMSWVVLAAVDLLTDFAGLPDWTSTMAFVLLMVGLPVVTATAFVQEGVPYLTSDPHDEIHPDDVVGRSPEEVHVVPEAHPLYGSGVFTWRNSILAGVASAVLLVGSVVAYSSMWALGVGPVGSLVAQGRLDEGDGVLLAEFENRTDDAALGAAVTAAFRVDLSESLIVTLVDASTVSDVLERMGRDPSEHLTVAVARDFAEREGIKVIVGGEISHSSDGYLVVARIVEPASGISLGQYRASADRDGDLVAAIDRASARIREKLGESLRTIRASRAARGQDAEPTRRP